MALLGFFTKISSRMFFFFLNKSIPNAFIFSFDAFILITHLLNYSPFELLTFCVTHDSRKKDTIASLWDS